MIVARAVILSEFSLSYKRTLTGAMNAWICSLLLFFEFSTHRGTRGHPLYPDPRVSVPAHCFPVLVISSSSSSSNRGVNSMTEQYRTALWNRLPASVVMAENIQIFKMLLMCVEFSYAMFGKG